LLYIVATLDTNDGFYRYPRHFVPHKKGFFVEIATPFLENYTGKNQYL